MAGLFKSGGTSGSVKDGGAWRDGLSRAAGTGVNAQQEKRYRDTSGSRDRFNKALSGGKKKRMTTALSNKMGS